MKTIRICLLLLLVCLPISMMADQFNILLGNNASTVEGTMQTKNGANYIVTSTMTYKVIAQNNVIIGDVHEDDEISGLDLTDLIDILLEKKKDFSFVRADINKDLSIGGVDLTKLIDILLGKIEPETIVLYTVEEEWIVGGSEYSRVEQDVEQ